MALTVEPLAFDAADLDQALARGIVTAEQFDALIALARERRIVSALPDDEQFRLLSNFNDIFVTLAILVLLFGIGGLVGRAFPGHSQTGLVVAGVLIAAIAWALAGYFTLKRRMALPSIVLLLAFVLGVSSAAGLGARWIASYPEWGELNEFDWKLNRHCEETKFVAGANSVETTELGINSAVTRRTPVPGHVQVTAHPADVCAHISHARAVSLALSALFAGVFGAIAAWLHWRRFRVPITVAAGAAAVVGLLFGVVGSVAPGSEALALRLGGIAGLAVFMLAMRFDVSDPRRETRRTDIAFWLHLLAAPLIVHPLMSALGVFDRNPSSATALIVVALYLLFTAVALVIDRRALLVSALAYVLYAVGTLLKQGTSDLQVPVTALVIGLFLVSLSALWRQARAFVVGRLPVSWVARLPAAAG